MQTIALILIRAYQLALSPLIGPRCRFYPSCSDYAVEAVTRFGFARGLALSLWRLARCHPFHPGGFDPCPEHDWRRLARETDEGAGRVY